MSPLDVHQALRADAPTAHRFVLVVMALHADHNARCALSLRQLGEMTGLSPQGVSDALAGLQERGLVVLRSKGGGNRASVYELPETAGDLPTPRPIALAEVAPAAEAEVVLKPEPWMVSKPTPAPTASEPLSARHVRELIEAAGADVSGQPALYWSRHEHVTELQAMLTRTGLTFTAARAAAARVAPVGVIRRLTALEGAMKGQRA